MIEPGTPAPSPLAATSARSGQSVRNGEGRDAYDSPEPLGRHPADHDSDARDPEPHHATRSGQHDSNHDDSDHNSDDGKSDDGNSDDGDQVCEDQDQSDYDCRFSDTIGRVGNALEELLRRGLLYDAGVRNPALTWLLPRRTGP
jgi:hypothetical protein